MSRILIVDDERALTELLESRLKAKGHEVWTAHDGVTAVAFAMEKPELILLDVMMPGMDGFEVCRRIRKEIDCPILFLSARQSETDKVKGLSMGGDDYITKPFGLQELMARIEANLRREKRSRGRGEEYGRSGLGFGKLYLDLQERSVRVGGQVIELTRREYDIAELLALHPGQVFSREQIYEKLWGYDAEGDSATVVERVKKIRAKLAAADPETEYITTVWGIGYKWNRM